MLCESRAPDVADFRVRCVVVVVVATEPMAQKSMRISAFCDRNKARAGFARQRKRRRWPEGRWAGLCRLSAGALGVVVVGSFLVAKRVVQQTQHTTLER